MKTNNHEMVDGIVLLAKHPGPTSFSSLNIIKHALKTTRVGHTGTLDSFAQGLLVVCVGRLTKLAGNITEFDKEYKAIIKFGQETDTLEYTGNIIRTADLPSLEKLQEAILYFQGSQKQIPPAFSAIHVNGKRASDLIRQGEVIELKAREINVYTSELIEYKLNDNGLVEYCQINFKVSKGTYIRSLARDIATFCGSAGHLVGLYRTRIGNFRIEDAVLYDTLPEFNIETVINKINNPIEYKKSDETEVFEEIKYKLKPFTENEAKMADFEILHLKDNMFESAFKNGKKIMRSYFIEDINSFSLYLFAVFSENNNFCGLIEKTIDGKLSYKFVIN